MQQVDISSEVRCFIWLGTHSNEILSQVGLQSLLCTKDPVLSQVTDDVHPVHFLPDEHFPKASQNSIPSGGHTKSIHLSTTHFMSLLQTNPFEIHLLLQSLSSSGRVHDGSPIGSILQMSGEVQSIRLDNLLLIEHSSRL